MGRLRRLNGCILSVIENNQQKNWFANVGVKSLSRNHGLLEILLLIVVFLVNQEIGIVVINVVNVEL